VLDALRHGRDAQTQDLVPPAKTGEGAADQTGDGDADLMGDGANE